MEKIMDMMEKLRVLTDAAKYDVACTSSGSERAAKPGYLGNTVAAGICHSFAADGRCISLLKVLMSNACAYDCAYCVNRRTADSPRTTFTPEELAELTINFYRRNYIEGLFLSSAVVKNPDYTCELMLKAIKLLREKYRFNGYIHVKAIPGADSKLIYQLGILADRMSVNIEFPSAKSLKLLAPDKSRESVLAPMKEIKDGIAESKHEIVKYRAAPKFAPAGQATQMIIGASPETDYQILRLTEGLYKKYELKRVFFSAYMPVVNDRNLPSLDTRPPLLREHRLYQADWLLRFYGFKAEEILDNENQQFNPVLDPKCNWAVNHPEEFPVEINRASYYKLLRVPGIGVISAKRIVAARKYCVIDFDGLKKLGVVLKRAVYFITCGGKFMRKYTGKTSEFIVGALRDRGLPPEIPVYEQTSLFDVSKEDKIKCLTGQM